MSSRVTRFLGKGKKSDNTPPQQQQQPQKKKKLVKGVGSRSGPGDSSHAQPPQGPPPAPVFHLDGSDTTLPAAIQPLNKIFFCEARMERYVKIREFGFNQEKGFDYDLLNGVPEI
ncbi:hypothetical protein A2U01_0051684, partial [Trifolium medium]|nr:hypothetical protein [Trifolium medium]